MNSQHKYNRLHAAVYKSEAITAQLRALIDNPQPQQEQLERIAKWRELLSVSYVAKVEAFSQQFITDFIPYAYDVNSVSVHAGKPQHYIIVLIIYFCRIF